MPMEYFKVTSSSPSLIQIEITDWDEFKQSYDGDLTLGSYLKIKDENGIEALAIIQSYKIKDIVEPNFDPEAAPRSPLFVLDTQPVGFLKDGMFHRGLQALAIPPTVVEIADTETLKKIYESVPLHKRFDFAKLADYKDNVNVYVDGDKFFSKHIAVVGSTGSGKSCTVARILQEGIQPSDEQKKRGVLNNTHIFIFDLHGEYDAAFPAEHYHVNKLDVDALNLPYWLMNSEELQEFFIDTEANDHNQRNIFKEAVLSNKQKYNPNTLFTYDTPVKFDIQEVITYIKNRNMEKAENGEVTWTVEGSTDKRNIRENKNDLFAGNVTFVGKVSDTLNGRFINFVSRLENKITDKRLAFLLGDKVKEMPLENILRQFIGYTNDDYGKQNANITIIDLSGIPFEVLSIVVSLISRLIFDFCYHFKKIKKTNSIYNEIPFLVVLEEAHNYVPSSGEARYGSVKKSIERIAKEGRKYGLSLMVVSQRPSEISETIFSQCNNFVVMRLTNPNDQNYVKKLLPDSISTVTENLPLLERREAVLIGDSIIMPSIVEIKDVAYPPNSHDIAFHSEWKKDWFDATISEIVKRMVDGKTVVAPPHAST